MNRISEKLSGTIEDNSCVDIGVYITDGVNSIRGKAKIMQDAEEMGMADGIESTGKINVETIDVAVRGSGILKSVYEALKVTGGVMVGAKTLLTVAKNVIIFSIRREDLSDKACPHLSNCIE